MVDDGNFLPDKIGQVSGVFLAVHTDDAVGFPQVILQAFVGVHPDLEQLQQLIAEANQVEVQDSIYEYVTRLTQATREHPMIQLGVSPRGALAVCRMAKAYAYLHGRDFVIPEDVAAIFPDVCCHRLVLATKARMMEEKAESIVSSILESIRMPVLKK